MLTGLPAAGLATVRAVSSGVARHLAAPAADTLRLAADCAGVGIHGAAQSVIAVSSTAERVRRVARNAVMPQVGYWRSGTRVHLPLRRADGSAGGEVDSLEETAHALAGRLAEHPDVLAAHWDGGLSRLVVRLRVAAIRADVVKHATALAEEQALVRPQEPALERVHPGHPGSVRTQAIALMLDATGIGATLAGRAVPLGGAARLTAAVAALAREDSRVRRLLRERLGTPGADVVVAAVGALTHGLMNNPSALALDAALRTSQLAEAFAQAAAFDQAHDAVCTPERLSVEGDRIARPSLHPGPGGAYADHSVVTSLVGAGATVLFTRDLDEAAEAVLAGSPKAARYGPAAFAAFFGSALALQGVLVRDTERLRQLELADTLVLHPDALRGSRRTVLEVHPSHLDWDHDKLWRAATSVLRASGEAPHPGEAAPLALRPVPDQAGSLTGLLIVSQGGTDIGTALVGWEVDPLADSVLDAARRAGLHVVAVDDGSLGDYAALADERVTAAKPLEQVVADLQESGRVVVTVARIPGDAACGGGQLSDEQHDVVAGLLRSDIAVCLTKDRDAVVWAADFLALDGLRGVWRVLAAVPAARSVARHSKTLAEAGAALSGLLVATRGSRPGRRSLPIAWRLSPVNAAAAASLLGGWYAAYELISHTAPHPAPRVAWHALQPTEALSRLAALRAGISAAAVRRQRAVRTAGRAGRLPVFAPVRQTLHLLGAIRAELDDPLTPVLAVGATASALLGSSVDAFLVTGALGVNATVGAIQRLRAEHALDRLVVSQGQTARRVAGTDGQATTVAAAELHPGDVIALHTGDVVPADGRLLAVDGLEVDESSLTGESLPTVKQVDATPGVGVADRSCMVFEGTTVVSGQAQAVVVGTGADTEAGRAAHLASRTGPASGVQARLRELTSRMLPFTLAGGAAVTGLSLVRGRPVRAAVQGGLAVAVAAVPEGLPLVATVAQLAAARRLSRHGILVRTPRTLEALGRMDTICFDKTGTLTENRLRVMHVVTANGASHPVGAPDAARVLRVAARACPKDDADEFGVHSHATDEAILASTPPDPGWMVVDNLPFAANRGYASAIGEIDGKGVLVVKGAPEVVLPNCRRARPSAVAAADALAGQGLRVLAVAMRVLPAGMPTEVLDKPLENLDLVGFVALADTARSSSAPLVSTLLELGVRPVMLTGDHPQTARSVAVALGWPSDVTVVTGDELARQDRGGRARLLRDAGVVARVAPEQKLQVVEALQQSGLVVSMVGDGSNDAAAIRAADIGIGIATRGSAAARNAADLVLTTDDLTVLRAAVTEGRALWHSVADAVSILIGGNAGEVGFSVLGTLFSGSSPLSTRQLLLVNLLTDMFPAMAVSVTPRDQAATQEPAPDDQGPLTTTVLGEPLARRIRQRGLVTGFGAVTAWLIGKFTPGTARRTSTMAMCGVVGAQLTQTATGRQRSPLVLLTVLGSAAVLVAIVQTPGLSRFFGCTPLGPVAWTGVAAAVAVAAVGPPLVPVLERWLHGLVPALRSVGRFSW